MLVQFVACHGVASFSITDSQTYVQITKGLLQKHGAMRVRDTPITEVSCGLLCHHIQQCVLCDNTHLGRDLTLSSRTL